ncbi:MAG: type II secretion system minor pseudopilin GspJ [Steroidobacteraceae bacterium]
MSARRSHGGERGFTLMELLVSIAIFSIVGALALSGYTELQRQSEYFEQRMERVRAVQRAVQTLAQDLAQVEPRPVREPLGDTRLPALAAGDSVEYIMQFTRAGWSNTAGLPRPTLQRVGYRLDQDGLWRDHWVVLDRTLTLEPTRRLLLGKVLSVSFRFLDANREWVDRWPAQDAATPGNAGNERVRPAAIEVTLDLEDWGEVKRLVEVAG